MAGPRFFCESAALLFLLVVVGVVDAFHEDFAGTEFVEGRFSGKAVRKSSRATAKKLCALPMNIF